jgi:hypothetical protein
VPRALCDAAQLVSASISPRAARSFRGISLKISARKRPLVVDRLPTGEPRPKRKGRRLGNPFDRDFARISHRGRQHFLITLTGRYGGLARRNVTVCWAALFMLADVQCPHPRPCYGHVRPEDAANNFAVGQDVRIVIAPVAGGTPCAFQSEVILLHPNAPDLVAESTPARPERPGWRHGPTLIE